MMLIEDEPDALAGMTRIAAGLNRPDLTLHTADNAESALSLIQAFRPELIVTDIMLPRMTGLELIETVVDEGGYKPKVIVVSGFNDFEYARQSIRLGAFDYLLKPFRTEDLRERIEKAIDLVLLEKKLAIENSKQQSLAERGNDAMRDEYLIDFCTRPTSLEEHLYQRLRFWQIAWLAEAPYTVMLMDVKGYPDGKPLHRDYALQTFAIGNIVSELAEAGSSSVLLKDPKNRWMLITTSDQPEQTAKNAVASVGRYQRITLAVGISAKMQRFEQLHEAYAQAQRAFQIYSLSDDAPMHYESPAASAAITADSIPEAIAALIVRGDKETLKDAVSTYFRQAVLQGAHSYNHEEVVRILLGFLSRIHLALKNAEGRQLEEVPMRVWEELDECRTLDQYSSVLVQYVLSLCRKTTQNAVIARAIRIIEDHYAEDLTLQTIADRLSMHPVWLSQSFKRETGQTYMDFLTETRLGHARRLLTESSMKIYEIAEAVGYRDLQHFGNVFKKRVGLTPKEFRYGK
ncbi:response regulator [Cohnella sp. GCM10012308]|uniref:response regulator transcription factor n=1 Tax=Cohnella sp. GCM10012308 TaxID=3317329 RepID=UPI0036119A4C